MVVGEARHETDVLVIGSGPGGYTAAIRAAQLGKSVTVVEKEKIGGVCLNVGCIPSKALISAAHRYEEIRGAAVPGIGAESVSVDFGRVQTWKNGVVEKLTGGIRHLFKAHGIRLTEGEAFFTGANEVRVASGYEGARYAFNHCVIATGSRPAELKAFPFGKRILSSTEALALPEIPASLAVIGGGYIGIELGQMFAKFGTKVTIVEGAASILPGFEQEAVRLVSRKLRALGVDVYTEAEAREAEQRGDGVTVVFAAGGEEKRVTADYLLVTVGRRPNTDELGLDVIGLKTDERGLIETDGQCRTGRPNIFAIGDVTAGPALAHKASYEGKVAAEAIAGLPAAVDYRAIPAVVFSDPEIAAVGLSEAEARRQGREVVTGKFPFAANGRALSMNAGEGFVKLTADRETGIVLGGIAAGPGASDLIAEIGLAVEMAATLEDIALTIHAHPTLGEMVMEAAEAALGRAIHLLNPKG